MKIATCLTGGFAILAIGLALISPARADDEVDIGSVRAQLSANSKGGATASEGLEDFVATEGDLDKANRDLQATEAELVKQIKVGATKEGAPAEAVTETASAKTAFKSENEPVRNVAVPQEIEESDLVDSKLQEQLSTQSRQLSLLKNSNGDLSKKLRVSDDKVKDLTGELEKLRNRLMIAETEVDRLSRVLEERNRVGLASSKMLPDQKSPEAKPQVQSAVYQRQGKSAEDLPVATVLVDKANLRTGPGLNNSALMSVSRGTRLVVETRNGGWYRVFTPNGVRAWINSDVVSFGSGGMGDDSTIRIKGFNERAEQVRSTSSN